MSQDELRYLRNGEASDRFTNTTTLFPRLQSFTHSLTHVVIVKASRSSSKVHLVSLGR